MQGSPRVLIESYEFCSDAQDCGMARTGRSKAEPVTLLGWVRAAPLRLGTSCRGEQGDDH